MAGRGDRSIGGHRQDLDIVLRAAGGVHRVGAAAGDLKADEELARRVNLRDDFHGRRINDGKRIGAVGDNAAGVGVRGDIQVGEVIFPLIVIGGDQILAVRGQRRAKRVHADLNTGSGGEDFFSVGQDAVEIIAVREFVRASGQFRTCIGGVRGAEHRGGDAAPVGRVNLRLSRRAGQKREKGRAQSCRAAANSASLHVWVFHQCDFSLIFT